MKTKILLIAVVCLSLLTVSAHTQPQQWEYKFVYINCNEKIANEHAAQGWELSSASPLSYSNVASVMCVFRRPKA